MRAIMMLGQRIVEPRLAIEDAESSQWPSEAVPSLTVRRVKSAGLRIITESEALQRDTSPVSTFLHASILNRDDIRQEHANSLCPPSVNRQSYLSVKYVSFSVSAGPVIWSSSRFPY